MNIRKTLHLDIFEIYKIYIFLIQICFLTLDVYWYLFYE